MSEDTQRRPDEKPSGMKCSRCGHDVIAHVGGTGKCTIPGCRCIGNPQRENRWFRTERYDTEST
jgi:hypothetical protein